MKKTSKEIEEEKINLIVSVFKKIVADEKFIDFIKQKTKEPLILTGSGSISDR